MSSLAARLHWTVVVPPLAVLALIGSMAIGERSSWILVLDGVLLGASVLVAVHHAEVVAHRVGEPYGSLILALAVTAIEVGLILALMMAGGPGVETLARDTVFAAVMITTTGIVGLSIYRGTTRRRIVNFNAEGSGSALAVALTLATMTMVLPSVTTSAPGPRFTGSQLAFAAVSALVLWISFALTQTVRHRDFFLPVNSAGAVINDADDTKHASLPTPRETWTSLVLLLVSLVGVVGLAKVESKPIELVVEGAGLPNSFVGVVIALLVLLPECLAAVRNASRRRLQVSLNLAYGSAIASIGLTVPVIAVAVTILDLPLTLGLEPLHLVLLCLTAVVNVLTVVPGRSTRLQGIVLLVVFAAFVFHAAVP